MKENGKTGVSGRLPARRLQDNLAPCSKADNLKVTISSSPEITQVHHRRMIEITANSYLKTAHKTHFLVKIYAHANRFIFDSLF